MEDLYNRHRPEVLDDIVGQGGVVKQLRKFLDKKTVPHGILFSGPSGTGKTTLARILRHALKCDDLDYNEKNTADFSGVDMVRDLRYQVKKCSAVAGGSMVWLLDEVHRMTGNAQDALLKTIEDIPDHVYFILATTEPEKLTNTLRARLTELRLSELTTSELHQCLSRVIAKEKYTICDKALERVVEVADGSAREAIKELHRIAGHPVKDQLALVQSSADHTAKELFLALFDLSATWSDIVPILAKIEAQGDEKPEKLRLAVAKWAKAALRRHHKGGKATIRAYKVLSVFLMQDCDRGGWSSFDAMCYEILGKTS